MPPKSHDTQIIAREVKVIHNGRTSNGNEYTIWQVIATKPSGETIDLNLRSFEELPTGEVLDVEVTPFHHPQFGTSYTLKRKGGHKSKTAHRIEELEKRVAVLEARLGITENGSPPPAQAPGPPPAPVTAPPPPVPVGGNDADIPF